MTASIKLGSFRGIEIGVHWSWLIVFGLLTWSLADGMLPAYDPGWSTAAYWVVAAVASLLLFASVVAHELGHSVVALSRGVPVKSITLFIFGGVAAIGKEPESAGDEFKIAIAGPAVSLAIGVISLLLWAILSPVSDYLGAVVGYLGLTNLLLVAFNLIPGYPLDGGRVFRAIAWRVTGSAERATQIAATVGVGIGMLFLLGGIVLALFVNVVSGIWLAAIGWFLESAARQSTAQVGLERALAGVRVATLMDPQPVVVAPGLALDEMVDHYVLARSARGLPVVDGERLVGLITLTDVRRVPRQHWGAQTVADAMTPLDQLVTTTPDAPLMPMLQAMAARDVHQIPVVEDGKLVGLLTRNGIIQYLQLHEELRQGEPAGAGSSERPSAPAAGGRRRAEHAP
ncbi:MAG TPA: site-2 protease family protein [Thermomicrobiaceae bacterium]|nr:site-2 protease family protein [Thermomicrobiaceae bacterium]